MNKTQKWCVLVITVSVLLPAVPYAVQADDLQSLAVYQNKKFTLPKPYCGAVLQFDADGKLVQGGTDGAWTLCQDILVKEIHRTGDLINVTGQRIYLRYDAGKRKFREVNEEIDLHSKKYKDLVDGQQVAIQISLPAGQDAAAVQAAIDLVLRPMDLSPPQPDSELWQEFLSKPQNKEKKIASVDVKGSQVLSVGNGVTAPVAVITPEPEYAKEAKQAKYMGTGIYTAVIDREGNVVSVKVARPLGLGLDENAAQKVRTWQFKPALKDGKPVAVVMHLEVSFNLY